MYYQKEMSDILNELKTSKLGLMQDEVNKRLQEYGKNEIKINKKVSFFKLMINQIKSFIIYILIVAAIISLLLGELTDGIVIVAIIILNMLLGAFQDFKAEKAIEALQELSSPLALVLRNGKKVSIPSEEMVVGDVVFLEEGTKISADARLIEQYSLKVDESSLTGESIPISKKLSVIKKEVIVADRINMIFAGTSVINGRGVAVVVNTGYKTELGKIAHEIQIAPEKVTPLQKKLEKLGKQLTYAILIICLVVFGVGLLRGENFLVMFLATVALVVAAVPEGLPAVVTISLALGTQKMLKVKSLIRRLPAVETLGSTTIICSDKTGTLTKNEMTVTEFFMNDVTVNVTGRGYDVKGHFFLNGKQIKPKHFEKLFEIASLCNNATVEEGDPTERALVVLSKKANFNSKYKRVDEMPFSSENKYMTTLNKIKGKNVLYLKGAPEIVLNKCKYFYNDGREQWMTSRRRQIFSDQNYEMASSALRVLGFAYSKDGSMKNLVFVGLAGMIDPPREDVSKSIKECQEAGIRTIMITGDHKLTAQAIADQIGIKGDVLTGDQLDRLGKIKLISKIANVGIYARVSPQHKSMILDALKKKGHIVAMTGDGVNDAPALKKADIGIAVGDGTDVAKESCDMILMDNNFSNIVNAVKEGRGIFDNIRKFIMYLFSCNLGEVAVLFFGLIVGLPLPVLAIHLLWINLLTDGLPALALGVDPTAEGIMKRKPRNPRSNIVEKKDLSQIILPAFLMCVGTLVLFAVYLSKGLDYAQTVAFTSLVMFQMFTALNFRLQNDHIFSKAIFANKYLWGAIILSVSLQFLVVYGLNGFFKTVPLVALDWLIITFVASANLFVREGLKWFNLS